MRRFCTVLGLLLVIPGLALAQGSAPRVERVLTRARSRTP